MLDSMQIANELARLAISESLKFCELFCKMTKYA